MITGVKVPSTNVKCHSFLLKIFSYVFMKGSAHTCEDLIRAEGDPNEGLMADDTDSTIGVTLVSVKG